MDFSKLILKLLDFAKDYILNSNKKEIPRPQARPVQQPAAAMEDVEIERTDAEWKTYFREILQDSFSFYSIP